MSRNNNNRRRQFFANTMHREIFLIVFMAALIPTAITAAALFYVIFNTAADQMAFPEMIASNLYPAAKRVVVILLVAMPFVVLAILVFAYKITHRIVGPFDRIVRELTECIDGTRQGPIILRPRDRFSPLVEKINLLLQKIRNT